MAIWTIEDVQAQIDNIKKQLLTSNQSYSISPSDGGTGRSVSRYSRQELLKELQFWTRKMNTLTGVGSCSTLPTCTATFSGTSGDRPQREPEGWEIPN